MSVLSELRRKFRAVWPHLDERTRRLTVANEALSLGYGGVALAHRASGLSRKAIVKGMREIRAKTALAPGRIRRPGAGRKSITVSDPRLLPALEALIEGDTRGDPESPLRWTSKSTRALTAELRRRRHPVSHVTVAQLLHDLDYSLQGTRKTEEGTDHPDRDAQFRYINAAVKKYLAHGWPVISVDTKKKELVGRFHNGGRRWRPAKQPVHVLTHDFPGPAVPRAYPYGVYDIGRNTGFVNIGTDHDTAAFAVASILGWWRAEGRQLYPTATRILITADAGGSNGARLRLWKLELQKFADTTGLCIAVCHFRPAPANGTRLSTGSSRSSRRTGGGSRCGTTRRSSVSSPRRPRRRGCRSDAVWIGGNIHQDAKSAMRRCNRSTSRTGSSTATGTVSSDQEQPAHDIFIN